MVGKFYVSIILLFVRFALGQSCDCKMVDILKNIVQKEMIEREILASRVDMLESLLGSGTRNIASSSTISSEAVILERLEELETTTENIKTQLKGITTERQKEARLNSALTKAWRIHKLGFSNLTEDIKQSSSNNNKSFHNLLTDLDKSMRLFEFKFEELLNKSNNEATKQQQEVGLQFDTIRSDLNTTFNDYKSRMDTDMMVFINKTEKQLHDFRAEFEGLINRTNKEATTQQKHVEERFDTIRIVLNRTVDEYKTRTNSDLIVFINKTEKSLYDIRSEVITDECASNPCVNRATCLDGIRKYSCICMDGFNGTNCQTEIDECASNPCVNGATCVDAINGYSCRCQAGYMYAGTSCQIELDECSSSPCKNGATCVDGLDNYSCRCEAGYSGLNCEIEIDECSSSPCLNGATCVDELNNYTCRCVSGYSGLNCQTEIDECSSSPCLNGATCVDELNNYTCRCVAGYSGLNCQTEIDECSSSPCLNGATCVDELNNYTCRCVAGYSGLNCQTDINECSSNPCMNGATCVDGLSNYSCTCMAGYSGVNCQIVSVCDVTLTGPAGEITSPNYPSGYPNYANCYYRITVATGHRVRIVILHFDIEERHDLLRVHDGADINSRTMADLTGRLLPAVTTYISTTNVMFLRFTTDGSVVYSGFRLQYSEV